jgi:PleD family two-component response regulator
VTSCCPRSNGTSTANDGSTAMALILIVDDSPTEVFQMRRMLENHGF